jgi:UDP-glucose 4-epimerase
MFNVYGKGQNGNFSGVITKFLRNIANDKPIVIYGDGEQTRDFVSIYDVVKAFEIAIESEKIGTYNIASGKSISINELAKTLLSILNKKLEIIHMEKQKGDIQTSQADITLAGNELGFIPKTSLKEELSSIYHE